MGKKSPERSAADYLPPRLSLASLRRAADGCEGCDLYKNATQTVFGAGPRRAKLLFLGEMPGDAEDLAGQPFVGPAGRLFDRVLAAIGLARDEVYITNAVKHFRWEPRGKRRLHKRPDAGHIEACRPWLQAEILLVKPPLVVCLGATAAQTLLGRTFRITRSRGQVVETADGLRCLATYHPAAILRAPDENRKHMHKEFVDDLQTAAASLNRSPRHRQPK